MRLLIVGMNKLRFMPYAAYYLNAARGVPGAEVHIALWDRDGRPDTEAPDGVVPHYYSDSIDDSSALENKVSHILGYRAFLNGLVDSLEPDKLVVMHTTAAMLLYGKLMGVFRRRYAFDYRDVTYERFLVYRHMLERICTQAACVFTSSDGFRHFFPGGCSVYTTHNIVEGVKALRIDACERSARRLPIRISFWGRVRHAKVNEAIIDAIGGDSRFELHYHGLMQGEVKALVEDAQCRYGNVFAHGEYDASQTGDFARDADLVHNLYDKSDPTIPFAMGNKYYDALLYGVPQLCTEGSYMGDRVGELGIGMPCDPFSATFADDVLEYWGSLDWAAFDAARKRELVRVTGEAEASKAVLLNWLGSR